MTSSRPPSTVATSKRIDAGRTGDSSSHREASTRSRCRFSRVTASAGSPKVVVVRAFTSQNTNVRPRRTTRSSSP
jgi:hypothetical protein